MDYSKAFATNLRVEMARQQMNQKELAEASGISQATVSRLVRGRGEGRMGDVFRIATALHVSPSVLFEEHGMGVAA